jgi:hypothetical protein
MKSFKEFITENKEKHKTYGYVTNSFGLGSQPKVDPDDDYIANSFVSTDSQLTPVSPSAGYMTGFNAPDPVGDLGESVGSSFNDYIHKNHNPELGSNSNEIMDSLPKIKTIKDYALDSTKANEYLLDLHKKGKKPNRFLKVPHNIPVQDAALSQHTLHHDLVIHSPLNIIPRTSNHKLVTAISGSLEPNIAMRYTRPDVTKDKPIRRLMRITIPKGHPLAVIGTHSRNAHEHEIAIPRTDSQKKGMKTEFHFGPHEVYKDTLGHEVHVYPTTLVHHQE